jgi:hypothetical protein
MKSKTIYTFCTICTLIGVSIFILLWAWIPPSLAGMSSLSFSVPAQVLDGGGSLSSSAGFRHLGAVGQSTPIGVSKSSSFVNQAGFIPQLAAAAPVPSCKCGDANNDGSVDIFDALAIAEYDAGTLPASQIPCLAACDVDQSGTVDIFDALMIAEYDAGIITVLFCQ